MGSSSGTGKRRIVVAGDVTMDWHLARTRKRAETGVAWNAEDRTEVYGQLGGASMLADLIEAVARTLEPGLHVQVDRTPKADVSIRPGDPRLFHSYAVWSRYARKKGDRGPLVWRVEDALGLDRARDGDAIREWKTATESSDADPDLIVLDDANLGFRDDPTCWPKALAAPTENGRTPWVLVKMSQPVAQGSLWKSLIRSCSERLVVLMTLNDLRLSEVQISRELSWERIAGDLARELMRHPAVNGLTACAHVVVSLQTGGAVLITRRVDPSEARATLERPDCYAIFDPETIENGWTEEREGGMIGFASCLAAGIAREIVLAPESPNIQQGVGRGLAAGRALHLRGYGNDDATTGRAELAFPADAVAAELAKEQSEFAIACIPQPTPDTWTILAARYPEGLEPVAEQIARQGVEAVLTGVPLGLFGKKFLTVDRGEIEGFRSIRSLVREYDSEPAQRPLNLAVFGPPGAGKSFGVKAVAMTALDSERIKDLTFNLSQLRDPADLADALHQVRDAGLQGKLPFVLWDEFDSDLGGKAFGWLRHFLAPMQDGVFLAGQISHPIGKAIFVFAGGTSSRLEDFANNRTDGFRLAKGPDFVSRLKGHVDIVGPDPRGGDAELDPYFRIRRAILLRSILRRDRSNLFASDGGTDRLKIDSGVLRAFLEVRSYRHGARSLESIVAMSTLHGQSSFERSALPAAGQLDAHVDAREFLGLVERFVPEGALLERLAEATHVTYCAEMLALGHEWGGTQAYLESHPMLTSFAGRTATERKLDALVDFTDLPPAMKEQNRAFARDLPRKLEALGYALREDAPDGAPEVTFDKDDPRVELLSREEHARWMQRMHRTGWRPGPRDNRKRLHPSVRPWDEISESERDKDRLLVLGLPEVVRGAGLSLVRLNNPDPLRVAVTGHRFLADQDRIVAGIEAALNRIESTHPGRALTIVSELAEGADRLVFQQASTRAGVRLAAVLPLPKFDLLADFESKGSKEEFLRLLSRADEVVELPANPDREAAYAAANERLLERADVVLAVYDGQPAQGQGGTAEVLAAADKRLLPIAWVHAGNRDPETNEPRSLGDDQGRVTYRRM